MAAWRQIRWYAYGAAFAIAALIPFLYFSLAKPLGWSLFERGPSFGRAWGALAVVPLALAAIPASKGAPWRSGRIRRLAWAAVIGMVIAVVHEAGVLSVEHGVEKDQGSLSIGQVFIAYALSLGIAVAFEPICELLRAGIERVKPLRATPHELLDEARSDVRTAQLHLKHAQETADRSRPEWEHVEPHRRPPRQRVLENEVSDLLRDMDRDFEASRIAMAEVQHVYALLSGRAGRATVEGGTERTDDPLLP